jgi:hypothetical protein
MRFLVKLHPVSIALFLAANLMLIGCGQKSDSDKKPAGDSQPAASAPAAGAPKVVRGAPIAGSGPSLKMSPAFHDDSGVSNLVDIFVVTNTKERGVDGTAGCAVWCRRTTDDVYLLNDAGNNWLGPRKLHSSNTLANGQCTLHVDETGLSEVNGNAQLDISVSFSKKFAGPKTVYAKVLNQQKRESNFDLLGTWTVTDR